MLATFISPKLLFTIQTLYILKFFRVSVKTNLADISEEKNSGLIRKVFDGLSPTHLPGMIKRYVPRRNIRSMNGHRLDDVNYNLRNYRFRAFSVASPQLWNALPLDIRSCNDISECKCKLTLQLTQANQLVFLFFLFFFLLIFYFLLYTNCNFFNIVM